MGHKNKVWNYMFHFNGALEDVRRPIAEHTRVGRACAVEIAGQDAASTSGIEDILQSYAHEVVSSL